MPVRRYVEENSSADMLAARRSAGVAPEANFRECVICMPPADTNRAAVFETKKCHQKSKTGVSVLLQRGFVSSKNLFKRLHNK